MLLSMSSRLQAMTNQIIIECKNKHDAELLRDELRSVNGLVVEDEMFAKAGDFDVGTLVVLIVSTGAVLTVAASTVVAVLSKCGYDKVKIGGKFTLLTVLSVEGEMEAIKDTTKGSTPGK